MSDPSKQRGEDSFVVRYLAPLAQGDEAALGLKDDAALLIPREHHAIVMTCDTLIQDRHFLFDATPASAAHVAHKALAVNVSDLIAKGATPRAYLMSLALPPGNFDLWMPAFVDALEKCQRLWGLTLIGGDTVATPDRLEISITAIGEVLETQMVHRSNAKPGDSVYLSGTIGDASLGLRLSMDDPKTSRWAKFISDSGINALTQRYLTPTPRTALTIPLRDHANAAIDVSDGLIRDLGRICATSGVGADIDAQLVPLSIEAHTLAKAGQVTHSDLFTGGDDYEIIACIPTSVETEFTRAAVENGAKITRIGTITHQRDVRVLDKDGKLMEFATTGWDHLE